ncbi:MAG: DUF4350 domain-containing protein [Acidobacteria bacterium]|nr:DUF4350 domain-containing protein [Acidobacteriota bacterium]
MPKLPLSKGDRKILLVAGIVFLLLVIGALIFAQPEEQQAEIATTYSATSSGAKAAYLLLQESGYHVARWEQSPLKIEGGKNKLLVLAEPFRFANEEEEKSLKTFLQSGGRILATGLYASFFLPESYAHTDQLQSIVRRKYNGLTPSPITAAAPQITLVPKAYWESRSSAVALYGADGKAVVVRYPYGEGEVIWWASATPLTNSGLKEPGNLEFLLACIGDKSSTEILWDEYFHGYGRDLPPEKEHPLLGWMFVQFAVLGAAIVFTFSRRSGPLRPLPAEVRTSPLEFVETLGGLYQHARASSVAVDVFYQRFQYRLTQRLGLSLHATPEELERAARERWNFQDDGFAPTLQACSSARYHPELPPYQALKLVQNLYRYAVELKLFSAAAKEKP